MEFTAKQIADFVGGVVDGNADVTVNNFAKIEQGVSGALSFLANPQYEQYIYETKSSVVLVANDFVPKQTVEATLVRVANPYEAVSKLLQLYESMVPKTTGVSELAFVAESATIGEGCTIYPFVYVGENAVVGDGTILYPHVTIYHDCKVGRRCILHAGCVVGADGFGFAPTANGYEKIPQIGIVTIEDDVELGANTCVDRSTMGTTIIRRGVKIDNLVQIAHNVEVGQHTVMSSQVGVAGSAKIGEWCMLGGQVGVAGHITVGDRVHAGAQAGIHGGRQVKNGNYTVMGTPAIEHQNFARSAAAYKNLPELVKEVTELKRELKELREKIGE